MNYSINDCCYYIGIDLTKAQSILTEQNHTIMEGWQPLVKKRDADKRGKESGTNELLFDWLFFQILTEISNMLPQIGTTSGSIRLIERRINNCAKVSI